MDWRQLDHAMLHPIGSGHSLRGLQLHGMLLAVEEGVSADRFSGIVRGEPSS